MSHSCAMLTQEVLFSPKRAPAEEIETVSDECTSGDEVTETRGLHAGAGSDTDSEGDCADRFPFPIGELCARNAVDLVSRPALSTFVENKIQSDQKEEAFYVIDLAPVYRRWLTWVQLMPRVKPYYAVKCNPDKVILGLLAALGTGFDCASQREIDLVASVGVDVSNRSIFANPCKMPGHIRHAKQAGCKLTTFDTVSELQKISQFFPEMELVLRIRADDPEARCQLGNKYGAELADVPVLLKAAMDLQLTVVGISFHVGSGATNPNAFTEAIRSARMVWNEATQLGFQLYMLDIGGGFCGQQDLDGLPLRPVAEAVNAALEEHFPAMPGLQIIAEPGRYFAEACTTLVTNVYGHRQSKAADGKVHMDYWISDGVYGSMNCLFYDHAKLTPAPLFIASKDDALPDVLHESTLFGPTCDGLDVVARDISLPLLQNGDWVLFPCMGAYTMAAGCDFNGFNIKEMQRYYVWSSETEDPFGAPF